MRAVLRLILTVGFVVSLTGVFALTGCAPQEKEPEPTKVETEAEDTTQGESEDIVSLQIVASRSLSNVLDEVQELYVKSHEKVAFENTRYLESAGLIANLRTSASADILVTEARELMNAAEDEELVDATLREDIFSTELVIVAKKGSGLSGVTLEDIAAGEYTVAIEDESTFAGICTAQSLSTVGAYLDPTGEMGPHAQGQEGEYVEIEPLVGQETDDVYALVKEDEVDLAIIYYTDAYRFKDVEVVGNISPDTHKPIIYSGSLCLNSKNSEEVTKFLAWATTNSEALKIWKKWGFDPLA